MKVRILLHLSLIFVNVGWSLNTCGATVSPVLIGSHTNLVDTEPFAVLTGDINQDGFVDSVSINTGANSVTVMTNDLSGRLVAISTNAVGTSPRGGLLADLNRDTLLDLAVANENSASVSLFYGNGDGTFGPPESIAANTGTYAIAAALLDDDLLLDLAVANKGNGTVYFYRALAAGGFEFVSIMLPGVDPTAIGFMDVNGDTKPDMITAHQGYDIRVRHGAGSFQFGTPQVYSVPSAYFTVTDMDGDGISDIVAVNTSVHVLLGAPNGTFTLHASQAVQSTSGQYQFAVSDLNGDGVKDVAVTSSSFKTVSVLMGLGDGTLATPIVLVVGERAQTVIAADLNNDFRPDLLVGSYGFPNNNKVISLSNATLPHLEIAKEVDAARISWRTPFAAGFLLQKGQLGETGTSWATGFIEPEINGSQATATIPSSGNGAVFRLIK